MMPWHSEDRRSEQRKVQRERAEPAAFAAHHCSSVVGCSDGLEPLLPCCVPAHKSAKVRKKWTAVTGSIKTKVMDVRGTQRGSSV